MFMESITNINKNIWIVSLKFAFNNKRGANDQYYNLLATKSAAKGDCQLSA